VSVKNGGGIGIAHRWLHDVGAGQSEAMAEIGLTRLQRWVGPASISS
jgi:hypothetical protein